MNQNQEIIDLEEQITKLEKELDLYDHNTAYEAKIRKRIEIIEDIIERKKSYSTIFKD